MTNITVTKITWKLVLILGNHANHWEKFSNVSQIFLITVFFYIPWRYAITLLIVSEQSKKVCQPHFSHLKHLVGIVVPVKTQSPKAVLEWRWALNISPEIKFMLMQTGCQTLRRAVYSSSGLVENEWRLVLWQSTRILKETRWLICPIPLYLINLCSQFRERHLRSLQLYKKGKRLINSVMYWNDRWHLVEFYNPLFDINVIRKTFPQNRNQRSRQEVKISPFCQPVKIMFARFQGFRNKESLLYWVFNYVNPHYNREIKFFCSLKKNW